MKSGWKGKIWEMSPEGKTTIMSELKIGNFVCEHFLLEMLIEKCAN